MSSKNDKFYLKLALNLAKQHEGLTSENPSVGCVIVKNNKILSLSNTSINGNYTSGNYAYEGPPSLESIPNWVFFNYDLSHSFITAFLCIGIVYFFNRALIFPMLAWPFHILLDFPFHSKEYFPTKFLWPLTDFSIDGIPWSNPEVWFPNMAGIIILFIYRIKFNNRDIDKIDSK